MHKELHLRCFIGLEYNNIKFKVRYQSCKLKNSWLQNYRFHVCMPTFVTFTWKFSDWEFSVCSSAHSNISKKCLQMFGNNSAKVWILFDMSSIKSALFGSNSLKVSVFCDMKSEKSFYYSLIWKWRSENISIAWYKLSKNV